MDLAAGGRRPIGGSPCLEGGYGGGSREHDADRPLVVPRGPTRLEEQTLKADPFAQLKLLDVQDLDSRLDRLKHRLRTLPEIAELESLTRSRAEYGDRARDVQINVDDLTRAQKKADADVEQVKSRRKRDQDRIQQGLVSNPKDLQRMQHELVSLERRISELEDTELEVMEELESSQHELDSLGGRLVELDELIAAATKTRDETADQLNAEGRSLTAERKQAADGLPGELLALYQKLRDQKEGVGAAALRARRCGGCRLEVNAADLGRIAAAPSDEVIRCEECSRILVRTPDSGI